MPPTFTVRPSNSEKEAFRVKLTAVSLLSLKLKPGDLVDLQTLDDGDVTPRPAIVWENSGGNMRDNIIQISKLLQDLYGIKLSDKISIKRISETLKDASIVTLKPLTTVSDRERTLWEGYLGITAHVTHDVLAPAQHVSIGFGQKNATFEVADVGGPLGRITQGTEFKIVNANTLRKAQSSTALTLAFDHVGGLQHQTDQIQETVTILTNPILQKLWPGFGQHHGLLLYGSKGTGKTVLQEAIARNQWSSVLRWTPGTKLSPGSYPQLIIADLWDMIGNGKAVVELLSVFQEIKGTQTLIVGEARHPNDISERLRTGDAFAIELELPVPDADQRLDILFTLRRDSNQPSDEQITELASRTHGYVGADLNALLQRLWISAFRRHKTELLPASSEKVSVPTDSLEINGHPAIQKANANTVEGSQTSSPPHEANGHSNPNPEPTITITQSDIETSLASVRPSALQQVFLEKPSVRWTDIGGQHKLKERLTSAVNRTLSKPLRERMKKLGLEVTKGVLLYGPPGCSKTLLAKALATEADLNFLAVKGAELISMYVGESERATREVFRKARAAAPSILFFDEIDAIASRSSSRNGANDLNVLTTLLNEMDGFEELRNVIVVAATNKPQSIDPALLRPGRFDNVVYVGLPDESTRKEIFEKRLRDVSADEPVRRNIVTYAAMTEGYSGAEVVAICRAAGENALDEDRDFVSDVDMCAAIGAAPKGVTPDMLSEYDAWNDSRRASG